MRVRQRCKECDGFGHNIRTCPHAGHTPSTGRVRRRTYEAKKRQGWKFGWYKPAKRVNPAALGVHVIGPRVWSGDDMGAASPPAGGVAGIVPADV